MKAAIKIISIIAFSILIVSCGNPSEKKETASKKEEKVAIKQTQKTPHNEEGSLILNDGKKWKANLETTQGIKKMQDIINAFSEKETTKSYASLKGALEVEFTEIFEKCTMKGEAHNQLHNYLKPMITIFEGLESSDLKTCKKSFKTMNKHLLHYSNYFE